VRIGVLEPQDLLAAIGDVLHVVQHERAELGLDWPPPQIKQLGRAEDAGGGVWAPVPIAPGLAAAPATAGPKEEPLRMQCISRDGRCLARTGDLLLVRQALYQLS
jgi:hypothetical protein